MAIALKKIPGMSILANHIPPGQFGRYLLVGLGNTVVGYSIYATFTLLFQPVVPHGYGYMVASAVSSFLNITSAFLAYKWLVFKTRGNYLREWLKCFAVYGSGILLNLALLPIVVGGIRRVTHFEQQAPFIAGALLIGFNVVYNFLGHRKFSFKISSGSVAYGNAAEHGAQTEPHADEPLVH